MTILVTEPQAILSENSDSLVFEGNAQQWDDNFGFLLGPEPTNEDELKEQVTNFCKANGWKVEFKDD